MELSTAQPYVADVLALILWGVLLISILFSAAIGGILAWHWRLYGTGTYTNVATLVVFTAGTVLFCGLMAVSALWYVLS